MSHSFFVSTAFSVFLYLLSGSMAGAAAQTETICGFLDGPSLWLQLDDGRKANVDTNFQPPYVQADYGKEIAFTNRLFQLTASRICITDAWLADWSTGNRVSVRISRSSILSLAPDYHVRNIPASHCEIFIDKAAVVYVDGYNQRDQRHYALGTIQLYLKILPENLDGAVQTVRFYGKTWMGDPWVQATKIQSWLGAPDYFNLSIRGGIGSFYVETDKGTRYWLNLNQRSWSDFTFNYDLMNQLEKAVGFYGYKYPEYGPSFDVGSLRKTADSFSYLNPSRCR